ncbi:MAG: hypothetical protein IKZ81_07145 [Clostridia bacterium]|nr:hypothetical protein [Clostridia bacterium]
MKKILSSLLAFAMVLALFSGVVIFNASAEEVQIHIPFINQYTLAQAQQMGKGNNSVSFAKDTDDKTIVTGTTSAANEWGLCTFIFDTAKGTDQWKKNKLVDGINIFEGAELSNKTAIAVKFANAQSVTSAANASNITNAFFTLGSSTKAVAIDLKQNTKSNGYFIYSFSKAEFVGAGWYQDCPTFKDAFFNTIDQVKITIVSNLGETELSFVIEDLYVVGAADTEELGKTIVKAESYEIDTTAERALYFDAAVTQAQVDAAVAKLNATIEKKIVIAQGGYSYTKLNGVQNWSAADVASLNLYGSDFAVSDKGIIGGVAQSIQMTVKGNGETRYCITSKTTSGMLTGDDNPFSFADATAGYKLSDFDGIAFALADADGKEIPVTKFTARLMPGINPGWNNYSRYEKVYTDISAIYRNGYYHVSFSDYANLAGETVNTIDLMSILFFVSGLKAGDKAYLSDIVAYKFDESLTVTGMLWEENYTPESWANLVAAAQTADDDTIAAAKAALKPAVVDLTTENMMTGWTTENVNAPVELNDDRLCDSIGDGLNADGVWNGGDFSKNTTFEANNNFSMTANVDFDGKSMGWKNLDRNTMDTASAGAYPALNSEGIENGAGIRFKLTVSDGGSYERLLVGLSNCAAPSQFATGGHREMYALKLVPEYFDEDGYINIPFSKFKAAWWSKVFAEDEIELAKVFIVEAYGVTAGTKLTISELTGYKPFDPADYVGDLWEYDYTSDSWAGLQAAAAIGDKDALIAAKDALVPLYTKPVTGNLMEGWNTTNVNAVVTANSNKLADYIKGGNADFTNNTTFEANNNLVLTAKATFDADKAMGWKNMDRSGTLATGGKNYGYPLLNVAGLKNSDGLRFKLEVEDGTIDHFVVGISNCATGAKEQYALNLKSGYADKDGYINLPWSVFEKASWGSAFTQANLEDAIVFLVEYYGATKFTTVRISDLHGYVGRDFDIDELGGYWQYNYTADSWTAYETAIDAARTVAERDAALALLVPYETIATTENFFKGWTTEAVNAVVTANAAAQLKDYIGDGLNTNGVWNKGDFSKNTTFAANDNFSMTATAAFADVTMGWKNLDRSATLNPDKNPDNAGADYPFMGVNVKGLSDAEGIRFKLDVTGKAERILIGLSNCNNITREMYALNIKPEYVGADGYINIPFSYFQKAWWCNAFSQAELDQVIVFIIEAAGVTEGTTITVSDLKGYREIIAPSDEDKAALDAVVTKLQGYDFNDVYAADITAAQATKDSVDRDDVYDATAALQAIVDKFEAVDRATLKANIAAVKAIDATKWATEIADGTTVYYNFDATKDEIDAAAKVLQRIIDKPAAPTVTYESTDSTITVTPIEGAEYKLGDDAWQDSNVFENLGADVEYQLSARIKANDDHIESDATTVAAKTQKTTFGTATVTISGTERYLETLTATANDVPALIGTNYEITWYNGDGDKLGTGETYALTADEIGKTVYAELSSSVASDTVKSDATAAIGKAVITGYTVPTAAAISYPQTLADSALTGGDTGTVTGTWTWVAPETRPLASQSGSTFDVVFTPDAAFVDLYEVIEEKVTLEINEANYVMTTFTAPSGLEVTGAFMETVNPDDIQMVVTDITYRDPAYQALLRASSKDTSTLKKLVLFKIFTFTYKGEEIDELYQGELTVTSFVGIDRAGETYSAWFFIADKPANYQGTVDAAGILNVEHVVL